MVHSNCIFNSKYLTMKPISVIILFLITVNCLLAQTPAYRPIRPWRV